MNVNQKSTYVLRTFFARSILLSILHNRHTWTLTSCHWEEDLHGYHVEGSCNLSEGPVERSVPGCYRFFYCSSSHRPEGRRHTLLILSWCNHAREHTAAEKKTEIYIIAAAMSNKICAKSNIEYNAFLVCVLTVLRLIESIRLSHKGKSRL